MFYVCAGIDFYGLMRNKEFLNVHLHMMEFGCPEVTLCG